MRPPWLCARITWAAARQRKKLDLRFTSTCKSQSSSVTSSTSGRRTITAATWARTSSDPTQARARATSASCAADITEIYGGSAMAVTGQSGHHGINGVPAQIDRHHARAGQRERLCHAASDARPPRR